MRKMNHVVLVFSLLIVAGAVEWVGTDILKRIYKRKTLLFSSSVWGSLMIIFSVIWFWKSNG
jgi:hypothetical protein